MVSRSHVPSSTYLSESKNNSKVNNQQKPVSKLTVVKKDILTKQFRKSMNHSIVKIVDYETRRKKEALWNLPVTSSAKMISGKDGLSIDTGNLIFRHPKFHTGEVDMASKSKDLHEARQTTNEVGRQMLLNLTGSTKNASFAMNDLSFLNKLNKSRDNKRQHSVMTAKNKNRSLIGSRQRNADMVLVSDSNFDASMESTESKHKVDIMSWKQNQVVPSLDNIVDNETFLLLDKLKHGLKNKPKVGMLSKSSPSSPIKSHKRAPWYLPESDSEDSPIIYEGDVIIDYPELKDKVKFSKNHVKMKLAADDDPSFDVMIKS